MEEGKDLQVNISGATLPRPAPATWISSFTTPPGTFSRLHRRRDERNVYLSNLAAGWYTIRNAWYGPLATIR